MSRCSSYPQASVKEQKGICNLLEWFKLTEAERDSPRGSVDDEHLALLLARASGNEIGIVTQQLGASSYLLAGLNPACLVGCFDPPSTHP